MTDPHEFSGETEAAPRVSDKSRTAALLIGLLTGFVGGHRYFAGRPWSGLAMTCTAGGMGLWWLADLIMIGTGDFRDGKGRRILRWSPADEPPARRSVSGAELIAEMEQLRGEVYDLQERVDFLERTLASVRDRGGLPPRGAH
jgi:hypothetical protein